jgi:hypothetical protein
MTCRARAPITFATFAKFAKFANFKLFTARILSFESSVAPSPGSDGRGGWGG